MEAKRFGSHFLATAILWLASITAADPAVAGALLSQGHQQGALLPQGHQLSGFGPLNVMASLDPRKYLDDQLYQRCMSGIDHLGVLVHPATLRGQQQAIRARCTASSTILADSAGKVLCQGDGNCGYYSILNGLKLNANQVRWFEHIFTPKAIQYLHTSDRS